MKKIALAAFASALPLAVMACGVESGSKTTFGDVPQTGFQARSGSVLAVGCALDTWQTTVLTTASAHRALKTVVLLCPTIHPNGEVIPTDDDARAALSKQVNVLRGFGYQVHLAVGISDETDALLPGTRDAQLLADPAFRKNVVAQLAAFASMSDGIEIDLQGVSAAMRGDLTSFVADVDAAIRPAKSLAIMVPPSTRDPSDAPSGDAYDLQSLSTHVDRIRVLTLDYSCCGGGAGPTIESGWAVDALRYVKRTLDGAPGSASVALDVAMPLYGVDFAITGTRPVTWLEADAVASEEHAPLARAVGGTVHYAWQDGAGLAHETWYDDAESTTRVLSAWSDGSLPADVGVLYYGLGSEDPALWDAIAGGGR